MYRQHIRACIRISSLTLSTAILTVRQRGENPAIQSENSSKSVGGGPNVCIYIVCKSSVYIGNRVVDSE